MEIRTEPYKRHPRGGPSCLVTLIGIIVVFLAGYAFANRGTVLEAVRPDPTPTLTQSPANYATRAKLYERDLEYDNAIEAWKSAIELDPTNADYYVELIDILIRTKQPELALTYAEDASALAPDDDRVWAMKAGAHLAYGNRLSDIGERDLQEFARGVEAGRTAIKLNPSNSIAYSYMAGALSAQGLDFVPQAQEMAQNAIATAPDVPTNRDEQFIRATALYYSAESLVLQGFYDTAREQLESAIELYPTFVDASLLASQIYYFFSNERQRAILSVEDAIEREPDNAELYDALAFFYANAGEYRKAEDNAKLATSYDPQLVRAHARLGHALFKNQNFPEAIDELETATTSYGEPDSNTAFFFVLLGLAYYYEDAQRCGEAIPLFTRALDVALPNSPAEVNAVEGLDFCRQIQITQP